MINPQGVCKSNNGLQLEMGWKAAASDWKERNVGQEGDIRVGAGEREEERASGNKLHFFARDGASFAYCIR